MRALRIQRSHSYLLLFYHDKTPRARQLVGNAVLRAYSSRGLTVHDGRRKESARWLEQQLTAHLEPQTKSIQGRHKSFEISKPIQGDTLPPTKATPLSFPNKSLKWGLSIKHMSLWRPFSFSPLMHCLEWVLLCKSGLTRVYETSWLINIWK